MYIVSVLSSKNTCAYIAQGKGPMNTEYNGHHSSLKLTVSAPHVYCFSPLWDHVDAGLEF